MNKIGSIIYRNRKVVLLFWVILLLVTGFFALRLPTVLGGNGFEYNGEYKKTRKVLEKDFNLPKSSIIIVFEKEKTIPNSEFTKFIQDTFDQLKDSDVAQSMISPFDREGMMKGNYAYGIITFHQKPANLGNEISSLQKQLPEKKGLKVTLTGEPVIIKDLNTASQEDLARAEMIGLPIALLVLILAFGSLVAAALPIVIGVVSILSTMGIVYFFSYKLDLTIFILNIVPMIGLALSIDFALLFINRYKEEIGRKSIEDAVATTIATAGRSIIFSALCVFIGLSGLWFIEIDIFQNVALGGMIVVMISALVALTFLPALLSYLGKKVNKLSLLKEKDSQNNLWHQLAKFVMRRPVLMMIAALAILLTGLIPVKQMALTIPGTDSLPADYPSRTAIETFQKQFINENKRDEKKVSIVLEAPGNITEEANLVKAGKVIDALEKDPLVYIVDSPFSAAGVRNGSELFQLLTYRDDAALTPLIDHYLKGNKMRLDVFLKTKQHSAKARQWVDDWSHKDLALHAYFGGPIKFEQEIFKEIAHKAPYGLLLIVISTFIILMAAFRSLLIPLKAILMNGLSLGCTFGLVVWIFQKGHLGVASVSIGLILPVFVFSLVFGLSMDYEVFLISRIQEFYLKTGDNSAATISGLTYTSKIITSAAAIMIVVTGAFAFTGVMPVKQLGVGIAIAIFIDATIVRMVLVPALMKLLGDWNWWFFGLNNKTSGLHKKQLT